MADERNGWLVAVALHTFAVSSKEGFKKLLPLLHHRFFTGSSCCFPASSGCQGSRLQVCSHLERAWRVACAGARLRSGSGRLPSRRWAHKRTLCSCRELEPSAVWEAGGGCWLGPSGAFRPSRRRARAASGQESWPCPPALPSLPRVAGVVLGGEDAPGRCPLRLAGFSPVSVSCSSVCWEVVGLSFLCCHERGP